MVGCPADFPMNQGIHSLESHFLSPHNYEVIHVRGVIPHFQPHRTQLDELLDFGLAHLTLLPVLRDQLHVIAWAPALPAALPDAAGAAGARARGCRALMDLSIFIYFI